VGVAVAAGLLDLEPGEWRLLRVEAAHLSADCGVDGGGRHGEQRFEGVDGHVRLFEDEGVAEPGADRGFFGVAVDDEEPCFFELLGCGFDCVAGEGGGECGEAVGPVVEDTCGAGRGVGQRQEVEVLGVVGESGEVGVGPDIYEDGGELAGHWCPNGSCRAVITGA